MEVELSPEAENRLNDRAAQSGQTVQEIVVGILQRHFDEFARTEAMLDVRYDELKNGLVKPISRDEVASYFREKSAAARALKPAA